MHEDITDTRRTASDEPGDMASGDAWTVFLISLALLLLLKMA